MDMEATSPGQNGDLISSVEAGKRFGCTNDYVARLARQGKVHGTRVGREWFVDPSSLGHFIMQAESAKRERATRLREQRKLEFSSPPGARINMAPEDIAAIRPRRAVLIETGALMVLGVLLGAFLFITTHSSDRTPAAVLAHGASLIERCADDLYGGDAGNTPCISGLSTLALGAALGDVLEDIASDLGFVVRELWCDAASWFSDTACGGTSPAATVEPFMVEEPNSTIVAVSPSDASPSSLVPPPIVAAAGAATVVQPTYVTQNVTNATTIVREYHEVRGKNGDSSSFSVDLFRGQVDQIYDDMRDSADGIADDMDEAFSDIAASFETGLLAVMGNAHVDGNLTVAGGTTFLGEVAAYGPLTIPSVNATSTSATSTFAGALLAARMPTGAHTFGAWSLGVAGANPFGASLLVNPSSAIADGNLIAAAVNGSTKFLVDAEGDIFANNLTTTGSVTLASTTASSFVVEGSTTLGDASTDLVTVNAALLANASATLNADLSVSGLSTLANASTTVLSVSGSTHFPGGVWNASGSVGIGTTSPAARLGIAGDAYIGGNLTATGTLSIAGATTLSSTLSVTGNTTLSNATATNFFATTASSTNLFASTASFGTLTVAGGLTSTATATASYFGVSTLGTAGAPAFTFSSDLNTGMWSSGADTLAFSTAGSERLTITSAGNVGIGTTSPSTKLSVIGGGISVTNVDDSVLYLIADTDNATETDHPRIVFSQDGASVLGRVGYAEGTNSFEIVNEFAESLIFGTSNTSRMTITSAGNVGIGTTTPTGTLGVAGTIYSNNLLLQGDGTHAYVRPNNSASTLFLGAGNTNILNLTTSGAAFTAGGARSFVGPPDGEFDFGAGGTYVLDLNNGTGSSIRAFVDHGTGGELAFLVYDYAAASNDYLHLSHSGSAARIHTSNAADPLLLQASGGNVGIGTTTPGHKLDVWGSIRADNSSNASIIARSTGGNAELQFYDTTDGGGTLFSQNGVTYLGTLNTSGSWTANRIAVSNSSGNVGIGTTNPTQRLTITGTTTSQTEHLLKIGNSADNRYMKLGVLLSGDGNQRPFLQSYHTSSDANTWDFLLNPLGGSVGIGTTTPAQKLDVNGSIRGNAAVFALQAYQGGNATEQTSIGLTRGGGATDQKHWEILHGNDNSFQIRAANEAYNSSQAAFVASRGSGATVSAVSLLTSGSNRLHIDSVGNVGINKTNPAWLLNVRATGVGTFPFVISKHDDSATGFYVEEMSTGDFNLRIANTSNVATVLINSNGTSYLNGGNVGIGTSSPSSKLNVYGSASGAQDTGILDVSVNGGGSGDSGLSMGYDATNNWSWLYSRTVGIDTRPIALFAHSASIPTLFLNNGNGNVGIGTTSPKSVLDIQGGSAVSGPTLGTQTGVLGIGSWDKKYGTYVGVAGNGDTWFQAQRNDGNTATYNLLFNPSGGNVGIGVASPQSLLHTRGSNGVPSTSGNMNTGVILSSGSGAPALNLGGYNSGVQATSYGFISSAYENNAGVYLPLALQPSGGNVGIGTASPTEKLSILSADNAFNTNILAVRANNLTQGVALGYASVRAIGTNTNVDLHLQSQGTGAVYTYTNGSIRTAVHGNGNVGIGTTDPQRALDVTGAIRASNEMQSTNNIAFRQVFGNYGLMHYTDGSNYYMLLTNAADQYGGWNSLRPLRVSVITGDVFMGNDALTVKHGGNVGIGMTGPGEKLEIAGSALLSNNNAYKIKNSSGTAVSVLSVDSFNTTRLLSGGGPLHINPDQTSVSTYVNYNNGGSLILGNGSVRSDFAVSKGIADIYAFADGVDTLRIRNSTGTKFFTFKPETATDEGQFFYWTGAGTGKLNLAGSLRFSSYGAGTLTTDASGNVTASSDERLKDIQGAFTKGLEAVLAIDPIDYKWKGGTGFDTASAYTGFSAQNVRLSIPEAVGEDPKGYLTLSDRPILAAVVNAIKELNLRVVEIADAVAGFAHELVTERVVTTELCATRSDGSIECVTGDELADLLESGSSPTSSGDSSNDAPADEDEPAADPGTDLEPDEDAGVPPTNTGGDHPEDLGIGIDDPALQSPESIEGPTAPSEVDTSVETASAPPVDGGAGTVTPPQAE